MSKLFNGSDNLLFTFRFFLLVVCGLALVCCASLAPHQKQTPVYDLRQIQDRQALDELLNLACSNGWPDRNLVMMLTPPRQLLSEEMVPCRDRYKGKKTSPARNQLNRIII